MWLLPEDYKLIICIKLVHKKEVVDFNEQFYLYLYQILAIIKMIIFIALYYSRTLVHDPSFGPVVGIDFSSDGKYVRTFSATPSSFSLECKVQVHIFNLQVRDFLFRRILFNTMYYLVFFILLCFIIPSFYFILYCFISFYFISSHFISFCLFTITLK